MPTEETERVLTMLPASTVDKLTHAAREEGLSRSALIRTILIRYLRERS